MNRQVNATLALGCFVSLMLSTNMTAGSGPRSGNDGGGVAIVLMSREATEDSFKLRYRITNNSRQDAWILAGTDTVSFDADLFMDEDGRTLVIRSRLDVESRVFSNAIDGRYVRLRGGQSQMESIALRVPVHPQHGFEGGREPRGLEYATRLRIELGYHAGDLMARMYGVFGGESSGGDTSRARQTSPAADGDSQLKHLLRSNKSNERLRYRDEEILIPYSMKPLKGTRVAEMTVEGLHLAYEEKEDLSTEHRPPDLSPCTRVEVEFERSALEYFFPYLTQRSLFDSAEVRRLQSTQRLLLDTQPGIKDFVRDVNAGVAATGLVRHRSVAHVACCRGEEPLKSFILCDDSSMLTTADYRFLYFDGFPSLRRTPLVRPFEVRTQCAANLKGLWYRLRLYGGAIGVRSDDPTHPYPQVYPNGAEWCDALLLAYKSGKSDKSGAKLLVCTGGLTGTCHYAMNPACKPESPSDMVLLFETEAGWNQHGGPELFTFDNHDPKGGLVLLNDGAVKFIRTEEELRQLRWK